MLEERLDTFWVSACSLYGSGDGGVLMKVLRLIFTLSHGNAPCERGFSVNKECLIENQKHETLVALRQVYDAVRSVGGVDKLVITKDCILDVRNARAKYTEALQTKEKDKQVKMKMADEKKRKDETLRELQAKRLKALAELDSLDAEINNVSKV